MTTIKLLPMVNKITEEGLEHDRQVEKRQAAWIAKLR